jgi:hypothetical protein
MIKPGIEHLLRHRFRHRPNTHTQNIGIIPLAGARRRLRILAKRRADAFHLVSRQTNAGARPAKEHRLIVGPIRYFFGHLNRHLRPHGRRFDQGPVGIHFVTALLQFFYNCIRNMGIHVGAYCNFHGLN